MRFDDINPRMNWDNFFLLKQVLEQYQIKSILGVVPDCKDKFLFTSQPIKDFFGYLRKCKAYGDTISQHGYTHLYDSKSKGLFGNTNKSEFAGNSLLNQIEKLSKGKKILQKESIWQPIFMAPNHSFDMDTLKALKKLNFTTVLDGFSLFPFKLKELVFIPQISSKPLPLFYPGISQLCIHINTIEEEDLKKLIIFVKNNHKKFITLKDIQISYSLLKFFDRLITSLIVKSFRFKRNLKVIFQKIILKIICFLQRTYYKIKLRNLKIYKWHLKGTFYCRNYKIKCLKIINKLKPNLYIDIGCGLGEILSKVDLDSQFKLGFDNDQKIDDAINILHKNEFMFFKKFDYLLNHLNKIRISEDDVVAVSLLNFVHNISSNDLKQILNKLQDKLGKYILLIDNIYVNSKEYKYCHHDFLYQHDGLIKYMHQVDNLRSLYCIKVS